MATAKKTETAAKKAPKPAATKTAPPASTGVKKPATKVAKPVAKAVTPKAAVATPTVGSKPSAKKLSSSAKDGTSASPWTLNTPSGTASYQAWRDETLSPPALVVQVGKTQLRYHLCCLTDLHKMLKSHGDWMLLGSADEQKPAAEDTVEAWGRSAKNPVKGWYGIKKGLRGRFGMYLPPVMELLGLAEVEHHAKNNRMRAI